MSKTTTLRLLVEERLGGQLENYVRARRLAGRSWRLIAIDLRDEIGLDVTFESLRAWFGDEDWAQTAANKGGHRRDVSGPPSRRQVSRPQRRGRRRLVTPTPDEGRQLEFREPLLPEASDTS